MSATERVMTMIGGCIYGDQGFFNPSRHTRTYLEKLGPLRLYSGYGNLDAKASIRCSFGYYSMIG
jgi:hypothetical protein